MAWEIRRPDTAFSLDRRLELKKRPREHAKKHLAWIRTLPCVITLRRGRIHAAHVRYPAPSHNKRAVGIGEKPDDKWVVPLDEAQHISGEDAQHKSNEKEWWARKGIDPIELAAALWDVSGDDEAAHKIIMKARKGIKP